jgi:hypothetical protein
MKLSQLLFIRQLGKKNTTIIKGFEGTTMNRHFYISNDLNDLEQIELELEQEGISAAHSHVLSLDDAEVAAHPSLNEVEAVLRTDVVHSTKVGAVVGVIAATLMIYVVSLTGWAEKATWVPFVFLAIAMLGFFTWEFGFIGIQRKNNRFARFEKALKRGKHIFFVDIESENESILSKILKKHPKLKRAGDGPSVPQWFVSMQGRFGLFKRSIS